MKQLIETFKEFFASESEGGGELAETASFTLENVNWVGELNNPRPVGSPVVDKYLHEACTHSGTPGSGSNTVAEALLKHANQLVWHLSFQDRLNEPDMAAFSAKYTFAPIIGEGGLLPCDKVAAGFSLQGSDIYYPPHSHRAIESYWVIGGDGDWKVDTNPWFSVKPGDSIYHKSWARHAMQTNTLPMLAIWLWTSDLDSDVLILRG